MRRTLILTWMLVSIAPAALAQPRTPPVEAQEDLGPDEVALSNGGMIRGTILTYEPGQELLIFINGSKEKRKVPAAQISKVERGKYTTASSPPATVAPVEHPPTATSPSGVIPYAQAPTTPTHETPGVVRMHIETDSSQVQLRRWNGTVATAAGNGVGITTVSEILCRAPCDIDIDGALGQEFYFGGVGLVPSKRFQLLSNQGPTTAQVKAGDASRRTAGIWTTAIGFGAFVIGLGAFAFNTKPNAELARISPEEGRKDQASYDHQRTAGLVATLGGAIATGVGIALLWGSGTSFSLRPTTGQ